MKVVLRKGRGQKRQWNGVDAEVVPSSTLRGGWVSVRPANPSSAAAPRIKWRNGAWDTVDEANDGAHRLDQMPFDVLSKIAECMATSDGTHVRGRYRTRSDWEDEYGRYVESEGVAALDDQGLKDLRYDLETIEYDSDKPILSLHGTSSILRTFALLSKDMNQFVSKFLDDSLLDVYLHAIPRRLHLFCILWIRRKRLSLSSVHMHVGSTLDAALALTMLRHCNTEECRLLNIKSEQTILRVVHATNSCMVREAWYARFGSDVMDLTASDPSKLGADDRLYQLGVKPFESDFALISLTDAQFFDHALKECPNIEVLKLRTPDNSHYRTLRQDPPKKIPFDTYPALRNLTKLKLLSLVGNFEMEEDEIELSKLPSLRGLILCHGNGYNGDSRCKIRSDTLEIIDVRGTGKMHEVSRCRCPRLRYFVCRSSGFYGIGGGAGPIPSSVDLSDLGARHRALVPLEGRYLASYGFHGLETPDGCSLFF